MTDRRPLGTGPVPAAAPEPLPASRAQLIAERLSAVPAADIPLRRPETGRRKLGAGPVTEPVRQVDQRPSAS